MIGYDETLSFLLDKFNVTYNRRTPMPIEVRNFGRGKLAELFKELDFNIGAEIGVFRGQYSEVLLRANPSLKLYSIDPWRTEAIDPDLSGFHYTQEEFDGFYKMSLDRLSKYPNAHVVRAYSMDAVKAVSDNSLDFVYIDGNHDFKNATDDIFEWSKKVKPGGIIAGHDYIKFGKAQQIHVVYVVNAYTRCFGIAPWFVLGSKEKGIKGEIRDFARSWLWVKQ